MDENPAAPLIIAFVSDLMFAVQIEQVAGRFGLRCKIIESAAQAFELAGLPGEAGSDEEERWQDALAHLLIEWRPAVVIFDINNDQVPWSSWIKWIVNRPAGKEIRVVCFGSHVDVDRMKAAREAGADQVLARSRFVQVLPELLNTSL